MILLGNPGNSFIINQFVLEKQITIQQAKRLIYCISIPSISFMLMTIPYLFWDYDSRKQNMVMEVLKRRAEVTEKKAQEEGKSIAGSYKG